MAFDLTRAAEEGRTSVRCSLFNKRRARVSFERQQSATPRRETARKTARTLDLGNRRQEDVALELLVAKLLLDVAEDGRDEVALLLLAELRLVADVRVEDRLDLGRDGRLLLEAERLVLELGGLLCGRTGGMQGVSEALRGGAREDGCGRGRTLESSKSCLVSCSTSLSSWTDSMRAPTAAVWAARDELRMSLTFCSSGGHRRAPPGHAPSQRGCM